jgi:putative ABC transport system permease protein
MIWSVLVMALREIRRNTMRSSLTALGIVIGVAAVISMVSLGQSATAKVTNDVSALGNDMLTLMPGAERRGPTTEVASLFKMADVAAIRRQIPRAEAVAPSVSRNALVVYGNKNHSTSVTGSTKDLFVVRGLEIRKGRGLTDIDVQGGASVCVLGATVQKELFGGQDPLGATIRIGKVSCRVIGLIEPKGQSSFGTDQDDLLIMPITSVQRRIAGTTDIGAIYVKAKDGATASVKRQLASLMRERRRIGVGQTDDFSVMDMKEFSDALGTITGALTALLGAIAAVSLLVGGIGIMNITLVSVTERTREIGLRMAIGARAHEVLLQFLTEAMVLSTLGGVIGIVLGLGGSYGAASALDMPFVVSLPLVGLAFAFSASVGVGFGFFPARKAARLDPIEGLRHE